VYFDKQNDSFYFSCLTDPKGPRKKAVYGVTIVSLWRFLEPEPRFCRSAIRSLGIAHCPLSVAS
jgi:hypothetical protein